MSDEEALLREEPPADLPAPVHVEPGPEQAAEPVEASAFDKFKEYLDKQLATLKDDLTEETRSASASAAKKAKESSEVQFRFEGNKRQHKFNCSLLEKVEVIEKAIEKKRTTRAKEVLKELDKDLKKRNKLIRLADKSPAGWDLVNEYLSDELASGSEDEKRIRKAEQTALRKKNLKQKREKSTRATASNAPYSVYRGGTNATGGTYTSTYTSNRFPSNRAPKAKPSDICFACGLSGHWRQDCVRRPSTSTSTSQRTPTNQGGNQQ